MQEAFPPATATSANPVVIAFPPVAADVAEIAYDIEQLPLPALVPLARNLIALAESKRADPAFATANQHAIFGAMLALCRTLDAADYPWDLVDRRTRT